MTYKQIDRFVSFLQNNKYEVQTIGNGTDTFANISMVKSKGFLTPSIMVCFTDMHYSKGEDLLPKIESLQKQLNQNKFLIIIAILPMNTELTDNLWFSENVYTHFVMHDESSGRVCYETNFHYFGAKHVKRIIHLLEQSLL